MNLLNDKIFRVITTDGQKKLSLPALLAALGRDNVISLPGLQRHQEDAFYIFLCYLAGAALARNGLNDPVQEKEFWENALKGLAGQDADTAWVLVEQDFSKPAFMQPPLPNKDHAMLKVNALTPDELDLLATAKNHDLKASRAFMATLDEWFYALISLQTMSGYMGKGNQGICRMNSGFGN